jgi:hypothetical protein
MLVAATAAMRTKQCRSPASCDMLSWKQCVLINCKHKRRNNQLPLALLLEGNATPDVQNHVSE